MPFLSLFRERGEKIPSAWEKAQHAPPFNNTFFVGFKKKSILLRCYDYIIEICQILAKRWNASLKYINRVILISLVSVKVAICRLLPEVCRLMPCGPCYDFGKFLEIILFLKDNFVFAFLANQQCWFHCSSWNWWNCTSGKKYYLHFYMGVVNCFAPV